MVPVQLVQPPRRSHTLVDRLARATLENVSNETLAAAQQFHGNLVAALDWSTSDPGRGLPLLTRLARVWTHSGRVGDAMVAIDHLMSDENAARYGTLWLTAAIETSHLMLMARGVEEAQAMSARIEHLAHEQGDDYHAALMRGLSMTADTADLERARDVARNTATATSKRR